MVYAIVAFLRPFLIFAIIMLILVPIRLGCQKWLPEGRLKRILLYKIHDRW